MRGKGEGSIYQRASDGLWVATLELPTRDGTRRRRTITAKKKPLLLAKLKEERKRLELSGDMPTASQTVEQWLGYWLREVAVREVKPKTMANYRSQVSNHIVPVIGKVRLSTLAPTHVRKVTEAIAAKGLSPTTGLTVHRILSSAFSAAEREGRIARNPAKIVQAPRRAVPQLEVLDVDEATQLIRLFGATSEAYLWATFMLTGARRGEILGLTWDRVTDVLDLSWQLQRHPVEMVAPADYEFHRITGGLYFTRPKSRAGWRVIPLVDPLAAILERWRAVAPPNPHGLVFATAEGRPIDPDWASKEWPRVLAAAGIEKHVRLHDLRHTAVDLLYEAGVPEPVIVEIVGHSSRTMTRGYRSRGNRAQLRAGMESLSALLGLSR
jgi:integrase